jgi:hypothetical protein
MKKMTMAATTSFKSLIDARIKREPLWRPPATLLALDPGGTTGWSHFNNGELAAFGQIAHPNNDEAIYDLILHVKPDQLVMEEYVLYPWKMKQQEWSDFPEPRLIGAIQFMCKRRKIPCMMQGANLAKGFCTDDKLKSWGYFPASAKHARDSIRHGCYFLLFNNGKTGVPSRANRGSRGGGSSSLVESP